MRNHWGKMHNYDEEKKLLTWSICTRLFHYLKNKKDKKIPKPGTYNHSYTYSFIYKIDTLSLA